MRINVRGLARDQVLSALTSTAVATMQGEPAPMSRLRANEADFGTLRYVRMYLGEDCVLDILHSELAEQTGVDVSFSRGELVGSAFEMKFPGLADQVIAELRTRQTASNEQASEAIGVTGIALCSTASGLWGLGELLPALAELSLVEVSPLFCVLSIPLALFGWRRVVLAG